MPNDDVTGNLLQLCVDMKKDRIWQKHGKQNEKPGVVQ